VTVSGPLGAEGVYLIPHTFDCSACDLEVNGEMLWKLGDMVEDVLLDEDPYNYIDDEPPIDEDVLRDG
jgi:predicted molibdopterin-dependent oxidoreductase YjgC